MLAWGAIGGAWTCWKLLVLRGQSDGRARCLGDVSGASEMDDRPGEARLGSDSVPGLADALYGDDESSFASFPPGSAMIRGGEDASWAAGATIWPVTREERRGERVL